MNSIVQSPDLRWLLSCGAIATGLSVAMGAFAAHALQGELTSAALETFQTASRYLGLHGLGLLVLAALSQAGLALRWVGIMLTVGVGIFSGSLYILCLTELRWIAWLTPVGGMLMLGGWVKLAWVGIRLER